MGYDLFNGYLYIGNASNQTTGIKVDYATSAGSISGILPVDNGGTGATTPAEARLKLDITPANIGAATSNHTHDGVYSKTGHNHDSAYSLVSHNHDETYSKTDHDHSGTYSLVTHNHNDTYSPVNHGHSGTYSPVNHNHDSAYSLIGHNHSGTYSLVTHDHSGTYSPVTHAHGTGDIRGLTDEINNAVSGKVGNATVVTGQSASYTSNITIITMGNLVIESGIVTLDGSWLARYFYTTFAEAPALSLTPIGTGTIAQAKLYTNGDGSGVGTTNFTAATTSGSAKYRYMAIGRKA